MQTNPDTKLEITTKVITEDPDNYSNSKSADSPGGFFSKQEQNRAITSDVTHVAKSGTLGAPDSRDRGPISEPSSPIGKKLLTYKFVQKKKIPRNLLMVAL